MTGNVQSNGSSNLEIAQSNQDLIVTKGRRKTRIWIAAGVVFGVAAALIIAAIILLNRHGDEHHRTPDDPVTARLSLDDILQGKVNPTSFNGTWVSDKDLMYTDPEGNLVLMTVEPQTKKTTNKILLPSTDSLLQEAFSFDISADGRFLMVATKYQKIYRYSYRARYILVNLETQEKHNLTADSLVDLHLAIWAPVGNALAFVAGFQSETNIYYKPDAASSATGVVQITKDTDFVKNGVADWVYEEEVFSNNKALWFSPDGTKLAFGRFDDSNTSNMVLPIYGDPGNLFFQYPRAQLIKYPKVGTLNPEVSLHYVDLISPTSTPQKLESPPELTNVTNRLMNPILSAVSWATPESLTAIWMNRVQNMASIIAYEFPPGNPPQWKTVKKLHQAGGWLELFTAPIHSQDGSKMALILSQKQENNQGSFRHLVLLDRQGTADSNEIPLTKGAFVVIELLAWNHARDELYFLANTVNDSAVQHLFKVSVESREVTCMSCDMKPFKNATTGCLFNSASFSKGGSVYSLTCAGPGVPQVSLYSSLDNSKILDWEENWKLRELVATKQTPEIMRLSFPVQGGFKAQVMLKLPPDVDRSGHVKYPMLVNVYAGPDSSQVLDRFILDWGSYLAANRNVIYATIDGRGSGLKGDDMLFASYRQLGTVEIEDQINVTRQIQESLNFVDATKTAIWGWSYGGYASAMALATDQQAVFKCGISVAPVTDWTLYDSIYTERFMGLPTVEDNLAGYVQSNLLLKAEGLRGKSYFLIHGTYDDNVHYQQSMMWAKVLERRDILFRQLSYPDEDHGLGSVRPHLYHSLENFLDECFDVVN